jgi:hypothetical protein
MLTGEKRSFKKHSVQLLIYDREHHLIAFSWNAFFLRFGDLYRVKAEKKVVKNALLERIDKSIPPIAPAVCGVERSTVLLCVCLK